MYARVQNLTNVRGRAKYVRDKEDIEEVVGFFDTASDEFWTMLARENQEQFQRNSHSKRDGVKASEGREIQVGLPSYATGNDAAQTLALQVKLKLGVECIVGIHQKWGINEKGERVLNTHAHIIMAERTLLPEPLHIEEKRAERTYYYDAAGKKCKKADAVRCTPKGSITQEACTRYFSDKINFFDLRVFDDLLDDFARQFNWKRFDLARHFPQRHIGKNNPKAAYIREYNELVKAMNAYFDQLDAKSSSGTAKEEFCRNYSVPARFGVSQTEDIRLKFEAFRREHEVSIEELRHKLGVLRAAEQELEGDIAKAEAALQPIAPGDFVGAKVAAIRREEIEDKYHVRLDKSLVARLKEKLAEIKAAIAYIIDKLRGRGIDAPHGAGESKSPVQHLDDGPSGR